MTRFLTAVVATFFLLTAVAHAAGALIYDRSVNDILNEIKKAEKQYSSFNVKIRGTHYYTGNDGFRYCESHFGDSDKHRLIFRLNDKGAVWTAWVIVPVNTTSGESNEQGIIAGGLMMNSIFRKVGLSDEEGLRLGMDVTNWANKCAEEELDNPTKTFSVWCGKAKRYINLKVSGKDVHTDNAVASYFIYAHD